MRVFSILIVSFCSLSLAACERATELTGDPAPTGRGYSSYAEPYKSPPGPEAPSIGYEYSKDANEEALIFLDAAAADLLDMLEDKVEIPPGAIYLSPPPPRAFATNEGGAFYNSFDHVLRDQLTGRGYKLSTKPQGATPLTFRARDPRGDKFLVNFGSDDYRELELSLTLGDDEGKICQVSDVFHVPAYGFASYGVTISPGPAGEGNP